MKVDSISKQIMDDNKDFIKAYNNFRETVDFGKEGILSELDNVVWCMLMGVPEVPADEDESPGASIVAIDQRSAILKAVFVEVNGNQPEIFIDQGLDRYDQAGKMAKKLLKDNPAEF